MFLCILSLISLILLLFTLKYVKYTNVAELLVSINILIDLFIICLMFAICANLSFTRYVNNYYIVYEIKDVGKYKIVKTHGYNINLTFDQKEINYKVGDTLWIKR